MTYICRGSRKFYIEERRRNIVHYMTKLYLRYESDNGYVSARDHLSDIMEVQGGYLKSIYGEDIFPPF
jgi:hypothetical protein